MVRVPPIAGVVKRVFDGLAHFARGQHALARSGQVARAGAGRERIFDRVFDFGGFLVHARCEAQQHGGAGRVARESADELQEVLMERLEHLMCKTCKKIDPEELGEWSGWRLVRSFFVFHFLRWYPRWATWLPRHAPRLQPAEALLREGRTQVP